MDEKTKKDLLDILTDFYFKVIKPDIDRLDKKIESVGEELSEFKDGAYSKMDKFIGEQQTIRIEQASMTQRLDDIESTPTIAHELKKTRS